MDPDSIRTLLFMLILLALSGYFSATETAFSTFNRIRMKNLAENGNRRARLVLSLSEDYDRLLSTILVGNNIVNIALTTLATMFFADLILHSESLAATVSTIVTTVAVLIFGEISPKSLAKESPERWAVFAAPLLKALMVFPVPVQNRAT